MTPETTVFLLTLILGAIHIGIGSIIRIIEVGPLALLGPRDDLPPRTNKFGLRGERANTNFKETLPWALGLLLLVQLTDHANGVSATGAWLYFWARAIYLPLYVLGTPFVRSIAFGASLVGMGMIASQIL